MKGYSDHVCIFKYGLINMTLPTYFEMYGHPRLDMVWGQIITPPPPPPSKLMNMSYWSCFAS